VNARRLAVPAIASTVGVVLVAGIAVASYSTLVAGSGTGQATPAAAKVLTLDVTGTVSTDLYPGAPDGADVVLTVANPYGQAISVTGLTAGDVVVTPLPGRTCTTTGLTFRAPSATEVPFTVAANATSASKTLHDVVRMGLTADSGCQGATFTIPFTVTGKL